MLLYVEEGVPVKEDTCPGQSAREVGWPVPFLTAFIFPVLLPSTELLLGGLRASMQPRLKRG